MRGWSPHPLPRATEGSGVATRQPRCHPTSKMWRNDGTPTRSSADGGGARGAYQAGVLKRIGEITRVRNQGNPFSIIAGVSAGAINSTALAAGCDEFASAAEAL